MRKRLCSYESVMYNPILENPTTLVVGVCQLEKIVLIPAIVSIRRVSSFFLVGLAAILFCVLYGLSQFVIIFVLIHCPSSYNRLDGLRRADILISFRIVALEVVNEI